MCGIKKSGRVARPACWSVGPVARVRRAGLFGIALLHGHLLRSGIGGGGCWQPLGPACLMRAPSVERGGGGNGWADGLTGGALRAGPEPPKKTSGEICWLEQCRPDAESSGPFSSGVGQRCRGGPQSNGEHALHQQGLPPGVDCGGGRGYRRCWADLMAGLANAGTMGLTSRRGQGGGAEVVVSGPDVGAGHPGGWLGPSQGWISPPPRSGCGGGKAWHGRTTPRARLETSLRRP